jgi:hypothetical protein
VSKTVTQQLEFARGELAFIQRTYPRWVEKQVLRQDIMDDTVDCMQSIIGTLEKEAKMQKLEALEKCSCCGAQLADVNETALCPDCT